MIISASEAVIIVDGGRRKCEVRRCEVVKIRTKEPLNKAAVPTKHVSVPPNSIKYKYININPPAHRHGPLPAILRGVATLATVAAVAAVAADRRK